MFSFGVELLYLQVVFVQVRNYEPHHFVAFFCGETELGETFKMPLCMLSFLFNIYLRTFFSQQPNNPIQLGKFYFSYLHFLTSNSQPLNCYLFVEADQVNLHKYINKHQTYLGKETSETEHHESITKKDRQLIQLLIENPKLTNTKVAKILGVSKQVVSERRRKLETEGIIQNYVFWNIVPRVKLTKEFQITLEDTQEAQIQELTDYLQHNWKVALVWTSENQKTVSGIILTDQDTPFINVIKDEFPFVDSIKVQPVLIKKFLGEGVMTERKDAQSLKELAYKEALRLSEKKSVNSVLFHTSPQDNTIRLVVLRNRRFHHSTTLTSTDKILNKTYIHIDHGTYEILKNMMENRRERRWIRDLQVIFTRNNREERRIKHLLRLAKHI